MALCAEKKGEVGEGDGGEGAGGRPGGMRGKFNFVHKNDCPPSRTIEIYNNLCFLSLRNMNVCCSLANLNGRQ